MRRSDITVDILPSYLDMYETITGLKASLRRLRVRTATWRACSLRVRSIGISGHMTRYRLTFFGKNTFTLEQQAGRVFG